MKRTGLVLGLVVLIAAGGGAWYVFGAPKTTPVALPGKIQGTTSYPSEINPAQTVCAELVSDSRQKHCVDVPEQDTTVAPHFSITVPAGDYVVYAIIKNPADLGLADSKPAYYTNFVTCGMTVSCTDHTNITVTVGSEAVVSDIRPFDWYQ